MPQSTLYTMFFVFYFFFFQAEDGIRDYKVTGVQTCALPILDRQHFGRNRLVRSRRRSVLEDCPQIIYVSAAFYIIDRDRSEERRVGKECRARWGPDC